MNQPHTSRQPRSSTRTWPFPSAWLLLGLVVLGGGCEKRAPSPQTEEALAPSMPGVRTFAVRGVFKRLEDEGRTAIIFHEEIPDFMMAMTMPLPLKNPPDAADLEPGDQITFRLSVTEDADWIDQILKTGVKIDLATLPHDDPGEWEDVVQLEPGDSLPDLALTNQFGGALALEDYRGRALAFTFFFTRCPLPDYCPRMSRHFAATQELLKARTDAPTNWSLLSISFDPEFDTPMVLKGYAAAQGCDTNHWLFATAGEAEIEAFGRQFDLILVREKGSISHNLRTVVVDPAGQITTILPDNKWAPEALAEALIEAAKPAH
ncbi:MAG: SCO family protein [Verrucomicrobiales bacterium]|nr:SCO family protein [Verrucomicrobiales bacterium]